MLISPRQMNLLQIPIIDDLWVPPQDPATQHRSKDFAIEMGFGEWYEVTPNSKGLGDVTLTMTRPWLRLYGRRGHRSGIVHGVWSTAMGVAY
jgi:hypothetical protein